MVKIDFAVLGCVACMGTCKCAAMVISADVSLWYRGPKAAEELLKACKSTSLTSPCAVKR